MKNREYRVLVTLALMASLVVGNIAGTSVNVQAADNKDKSTETKKISETKTSSSATPAKDETVYVKVDDAGNQKDVTVSDQLKNISSLGTIDDVSDLKDIKNVKGDETFSENNGKLVWQGDKKDICYQGTTTKKIPVGMKVTYELDGKKVSADDLEGKSGHLKIHYEYQNTSADSGKYTPFLMATGLLMDGEKFSNVTVDNGKIISDGDRDIVIGMGLPQLKEQLTSVSSKVDDLDIPDSFTVEADVTDYEKVEAVTVATNEVFNEVGTDKFDSLDELKDSMTELQDASNKLVSGSGELKDGLDTLLSSSGTLVSGVDQLASGGKELASGTGSLVSGANTLADGSKSLAKGTSQLADGTESLKTGAAQVEAGAQNASAGAAKLESGAKDLNNGIAQMQNQVGAGVDSLSSGAEQLNGGIKQAKAGAENLKNGAASAAEGAQSVSGGITQAQTGASGLADGAANLKSSLDQIAAGNDNSAMIAALTSLFESATPEQQAVLNNVISGLQTQQQAVNSGITQASAGANELAAGAKNLSDNLGSIGSGASQVVAGLQNIQGGAGSLEEALELLGAGATELQGGVGSMKTQLTAGTKQLLDGSGNLLAGTQDLNSGLGTLSAGASQVSAGSATLNTNMKTANAGAQTVANGSGQLAAGALKLDSGAAALSTGLNTLQSNIAPLISGVEKLDFGAAELNSGMIQFNEEGIKKLVSVFDGDIDELLNKANELLDASKEYKNFSGIADGMDGSVKFIFVSEK